MLALPCRHAAVRTPVLLRASSSAISATGASLSSSDPSSSSSAPRSPRPRRPSNVPHVDVDYSRPHLDLVAQPDPISNLRPILYKQTDTPPPARNLALPPRPQVVPRPAHHRSPPASLSPDGGALLSLTAFTYSPRGAAAAGEVFYRKDEFPREGDESPKTRRYREVREALDEYNQAFWASNNTRYHFGLNAELAQLAPADPPSHADDEARIAVVDGWNARWIGQEEALQRKWMREWWAGQVGVLKAWWAMKREGPL